MTEPAFPAPGEARSPPPAGGEAPPRPTAARASPQQGRDLLLLAGMTTAIAALIAIRDPLPLLRAEFWAEDATEFFFGAHALGVGSLITPVYGYQFLLSRIVAYAATFFGVLYTPYLYAWACLVLNALSAAYIVRDRFSWLVPARWQRAFLAVLLAIGPGTSDVFLNLASLPISLALLALLLLLEKPFRMGWARAGFLLLLALSSGQMVLWLPLIAYLWWITRARGYAAVAVSTAVVAAFNLVGSHQASAAARLSDYGNLFLVPRILLENAFTRILPGPFLGTGPTGSLMRAPAAVFWSAALIGFLGLVLIVILPRRAQRDSVVLLGLAYAGTIGSLGVVAISRSYAIPQLVRESGSLFWDLRYSLLPGAVALIAWCTALASGWRGGRALRVASVAALASLGLQVARLWPLVHPRPDLHWPEKAARVEALLDRKTGGPRAITILDLAVHPVGWLPNNGRWVVVLPGT
jgi:hypothetical protein